MLRGAASALVLLLAVARAWAIDVTACGQFVPSGEIAVLTTDLVCGHTTTFPFSALGVRLDGGATLELGGHSIRGDASGVGVDCAPQSRRARRTACRIVGPGTISGFELGIGGVGMVEVAGVTARDNRYGFVVAKCCHLRVTDVVADDNEVTGVQAIRLTGSGLRADRNGYAGIQSGRLRLAGVSASGNGAGGGVQGRGFLRDAVVTGNAGFDGTYDLLAYPRIRTRNTTCGGGIRLRTIFKPGGGEHTVTLGSFDCR